MRNLKKVLICFFVVISTLFCFSCFDDEDDYELDDEARELFYEYYGYYPDEEYDYDDDEDSYYYDDDDYYDDYYDEDYDDYDDDESWYSLFMDLFGLSDDDYYDDYEDDYGEDYGDYSDGYDYEDYDESGYGDSSSSSAYDYYFNGGDSADTAGKSSFYSVETTTPIVNEVPEGAADWTVMIYMCGSDLESQHAEGTTDLKQMAAASLGSNVNVVVQTGGAEKWHGYGIKPNELGRYEIKNGKVTKVASLPKASMGKSETLRDFVSWAAKNYPAKKYVIDFWNHGGGSVYGVCFDELYPDSLGNVDSLYASEIKKALSEAGVNFELFLFDTCLSATIEMADTLSNFGKYMVASEEVLRGGCVSYDKWITSISQNPGQSGAELGKMITGFYGENMKRAGFASECTMATLDLSKIEYVKIAFQAMASQMTQKTQNVTSFRNLVRNGSRGVKYGSTSENEGYTNLIDLGEFAVNVSEEVQEPAQALIAAIKKAVLYEVHGKNEGNSSGIAVFYPIHAEPEEMNAYADNVDNRPYLQYLDAILQNWTAPSWVYQDKRVRSFTPVKSSSYKLAFNTGIEEYEGYERYALKITSALESVNSVTMNLFWYDEDAKEFLYLGNDDDIYANWDTGNFYDNFNSEWITIGDCYVNAVLIETTDKYNYYSVPVELNGKDSNLRLRYNLEKDKFNLIGAYDGIEGGAASKGMRRLKDGDKLVFVFYAYDEGADENAEPKSYIGGEVTYSKKLDISYSELFEGFYYYQFEIEDIFGNVETTDFIEMEYADGMIYLGVDE